MINKERLKDLFIKLCKISSPSKNERQIQDFIKDLCNKNGLKFYEDDTGKKINGNAGNLIISVDGKIKGKPILLNAHVDTIDGFCEKIFPVIEDSIIKSDGKNILGADDKSGVAIIMETIFTLMESKTAHIPIEILFSVCEEKGLMGIKHFDFSNLKASVGLCLDSEGGPENIYIKAPSHDKLKIKVFGKASHAGVSPETGINAIKIASFAISKMQLGRIDYETTSNIGTIHGGKATNIIPDYVEMEGEVRSHNEEKLLSQLAQMENCFEVATSELGGRYEFEREREYSRFCLNENDELVKVACKVLKSINLQPNLLISGGGSDANIFNSHGITSIIVGSGMKNVHSKSEYLVMEEFYKSCEFVVNFVKAYSKLSQGIE